MVMNTFKYRAIIGLSVELYEAYVHTRIAFVKISGSEYVIIAVDVDDLNITGTPRELLKAIECLKREFEMKDLGKTKFCLVLQIEHLKDGILVHQEAYIEKLLKRFYMDKSHLLSTPIVVRTLDVKDPFRTRDVDEEILGPEVPYLSAIGALMFLDGYMSDPHKGRSQIGYVFTSGGTAISWRSIKQTIATTSSNHAEILAIHEASRECVWLRNATQHIRRSCGISSENEAPTVLYEDNAACIAQLKEGYIKANRTKHSLPKF
ncbi:retrovirus-related pol polyprotein from transposon TNT 1-94 [Tanacetum coccineum]